MELSSIKRFDAPDWKKVAGLVDSHHPDALLGGRFGLGSLFEPFQYLVIFPPPRDQAISRRSNQSATLAGS